MTPAQREILAMIAKHDGLNKDDLPWRLAKGHMPRRALAPVVDRLVRAGFVKRTGWALDKLAITETGRQALGMKP